MWRVADVQVVQRTRFQKPLPSRLTLYFGLILSDEKFVSHYCCLGTRLKQLPRGHWGKVVLPYIVVAIGVVVAREQKWNFVLLVVLCVHVS